MSRGTLDTGPFDSLSLTGVLPSVPNLPRSFSWRFFLLCRSSTPVVRRRPVWALPSSLAATGGISFDYFSSGYLDVSVHRVCLPFGCLHLTAGGLPHSEIHGSVPTCGSPCLFAAYRVLHRLLTPRHPPYALISLTYSHQSFSCLAALLLSPLRQRSRWLRFLCFLPVRLAIHKNLAAGFLPFLASTFAIKFNTFCLMS